MTDRDLVIKVYDYVGHDEFIQLVNALNNKCIGELELGDCEECKKTPRDKEDICPKCIANALKDVTYKVGDQINYEDSQGDFIWKGTILKVDYKTKQCKILRWGLFGEVEQWVSMDRIIKA